MAAAIKADKEMVDAHEAYYQYELDQIRKKIEAQKQAIDETTLLWENFLTNVQGATADTFYDIFKDGLDSWDDFFNNIFDLFLRLLAEMEKAAYDRVLSRTRLSNNLIDATWAIFKCPGNAYSTAVCQLKINGQELKLEVSLEDPIFKADTFP